MKDVAVIESLLRHAIEHQWEGRRKPLVSTSPSIGNMIGCRSVVTYDQFVRMVEAAHAMVSDDYRAEAITIRHCENSSQLRVVARARPVSPLAHGEFISRLVFHNAARYVPSVGRILDAEYRGTILATDISSELVDEIRHLYTLLTL